MGAHTHPSPATRHDLQTRPLERVGLPGHAAGPGESGEKRGGGMPFPVGAAAATALLASAVVTTGGVGNGTASAEPIEDPGQPAAEHADPDAGAGPDLAAGSGSLVEPAAHTTSSLNPSSSTGSGTEDGAGEPAADGDSPDASCDALGGVIDTGVLDSALEGMTGGGSDCSASDAGAARSGSEGGQSELAGAQTESSRNASSRPAAQPAVSGRSDRPGTAAPATPAAAPVKISGNPVDAPLGPGQTRSLPISSAATPR